VSEPVATDVRRLSAASQRWRLAAAAAFLAMLAVGAHRNTDDLFPFGPMAQYATSPNLNASINSSYVLADTTAGVRVPVPLNATGTGIGRAEVEGQLARIIDDPSLLGVIARAYRELHPDRPQYTHLYLMRDTTDLENGKAVGEKVTSMLAQWEVP